MAFVVTVALLVGLAQARSGRGDVGLVTRLIAVSAGLGAVPAADDCLGRPTASAYYAATTYKLKEWKGPSFAMSADGLIWQSATTNPPRQPFDAPATILR
jgi:hypothetical protein